MPKKPALDVRLAVRSADALTSSIWWVKATPDGQVYWGDAGLGSVVKYSFHSSPASRVCRYATPSSEPRKPIVKWLRNETPDPSGGRATRGAWIAFPTDYLSREVSQSPRGVDWITAARPGAATFLELIFTRLPSSELAETVKGSPRVVVASAEFASGETFALLYSHDAWLNEDLRVPAKGDAPEYLFSSADPDNTGRPVRIVLGSRPNDGDAIMLCELGGYPVLPNSSAPQGPCAILERREWRRGKL